MWEIKSCYLFFLTISDFEFLIIKASSVHIVSQLFLKISLDGSSSKSPQFILRLLNMDHSQLSTTSYKQDNGQTYSYVTKEAQYLPVMYDNCVSSCQVYSQTPSSSRQQKTKSGRILCIKPIYANLSFSPTNISINPLILPFLTSTKEIQINFHKHG